MRLRARTARRILTRCRLCVRACGVDRTRGERGLCGLDDSASWFREELHWGLENGCVPAHRIHVCGCNMRCAFCSAGAWVRQPGAGHPWSADGLAARVSARRDEGAVCVSFVGGEPTVSLPAILDLLCRVGPRPRTVMETNLLFSEEASALLAGVVDLYLGDVKFGNDSCALQLSGVAEYMGRVGAGIVKASANAGLVVRHLLLPGHFDCCFVPLVRWLAMRYPGVPLSVWGGYEPSGAAAEGDGPRGRVSRSEVERALDTARRAGVDAVAGGFA